MAVPFDLVPLVHSPFSRFMIFGMLAEGNMHAHVEGEAVLVFSCARETACLGLLKRIRMRVINQETVF